MNEEKNKNKMNEEKNKNKRIMIALFVFTTIIFILIYLFFGTSVLDGIINFNSLVDDTNISGIKLPGKTTDTTVKLNKNNVTINLGKTINLKATVKPKKSTITWTSSNNKIATVKDGKVTSKRSGTVTIKATVNGVSDECKVTIKGSRVHFININESGDAILLESNGHFALVDAGNSGYTVSRKYFENYLNNLGIKTIDFMIITHNHDDHNGGAAWVMKKGFKVNTIYMKTYTGKDSSASAEMWDRYNDIISTAENYGTKIVYVDKDSKFKESSGKSGVINLKEMRVYFFNTIQRLNSNGNGKPFNYYTSDNYAKNNGENLNSIVNLVRVNGHNVLLTGDLNDYNILKGVFDNKVKVVSNSKEKLDVYKLPHHANFNCTGNKKYSVKATYYVATTAIDLKFVSGGNGSGYRISPKNINYGGKNVNSCFYLMNNKNKKNAKKMMCNTYYANNSDKAVVFNLTEKSIKVSGGGQGKDVSKRCK